MERELRSMIILRYGQETYLEMMRQRERIAMERKRVEILQRHKRQEFFLAVFYTGLIAALLAALAWLVMLGFEMTGKA